MKKIVLLLVITVMVMGSAVSVYGQNAAVALLAADSGSCSSLLNKAGRQSYKSTVVTASLKAADAELAENVIETAKQYLGVPYVHGGKTPSGFDCSGFCIYVLKECGYKFTAGSSEDLYILSDPVSGDELAPGDLVFFKGTYATDAVSHSGIYIGNGQMIHAGTKGICIVDLGDRYWVEHFFAYGRM